MNTHWGGVLAGTVVLIMGAMQIVTGDGGRYWGHPVPAWTGWIQAPIGLYILYLSLRAIWSGEGKTKKNSATDEEVAAAKAVLDRMHFKKYGVMPDHPGDTIDSGHKDREETEKE